MTEQERTTLVLPSWCPWQETAQEEVMGWGMAHPEESRRLLPYAALKALPGTFQGAVPADQSLCWGAPWAPGHFLPGLPPPCHRTAALLLPPPPQGLSTKPRPLFLAEGEGPNPGPTASPTGA